MNVNDSLLHVADWLKNHENRTISILKKEQGDSDRVELEYRTFTLRDSVAADPDDYVSRRALLLHGTGAYMNESELEMVPLPSSTYEIALPSADFGAYEAEGGLMIETDRATYFLEPQISREYENNSNHF